MLDTSARESWDILADRLGGFIRRRVRPEDAEDVLQDVLVRIYKHVGELQDEGRFGPWPNRVAGAMSLLLWFGVGMAGRAIAFF